MERVTILFRVIDPEVLEAHNTTKKLIKELWECTDPLMKKIFKEMAFDSLDHEAELRLKSRTRQEVKKLHEAENPVISKN